MHSHLQQKFCFFVKLVEQITKEKSIADFFFLISLYYVKQTLPSLALIKDDSHHFGSEKEGGELFKRKISRTLFCISS